jgi:hypothetical protein
MPDRQAAVVAIRHARTTDDFAPQQSKNSYVARVDSFSG